MGLKKALERLDGVESFDMVLRTGMVTVGVREGVMLVKADLAEIVDEAGLTLLDVEPPAAAGAAGEDAGETALDPVCHMRVRVAPDALKLEHGGTTRYFCNDYCLTRFKQEPGRFQE